MSGSRLKPLLSLPGFRPKIKGETILVGLKRAIEKTFDVGRWKELVYLMGDPELFERHPRLLRSLYWGDDDYSDNVFDAIRELVGEDFEKIEAVVNFVGLRDWLLNNDPQLCAELLVDPLPHMPLEECEMIGRIHNVGELGRHAARIRAGLEDGSDPELAIGSAKELLESVLRTVTAHHEQKPTSDVRMLLKEAQAALNLDPKGVDGTLPGAEALRRTLSNLGQVVIGVAELRTLYGTGHGRSKSHQLELAHARLVVNAAISIATFLLEVWQEQQE